jgi:hypothetical protein
MKITTHERELRSLKDVFWLWAPLSLMWVLMALEGPMLQSIIARASDPVFGLATYGYSFFSLLLFEAPIFLFLSASNALIKDRASFRAFRRFALPIGAGLSLVALFVSLSGVYHFFNTAIVGLPEDFSRKAVQCLTILCPIPFLVGYRRMLQGVLVRARKSRWIAMTSMFRIALAIVIAASLLQFGSFSGAITAAIASTVAIGIEAICIHIVSLSAVGALSVESKTNSELTAAVFFRFYIPLAISSFVMIVTQPVLTFFIAKTQDSEISLAVWPVLMSFQFFFMSFTLSLSDLVIAHYDEHPGHAQHLTRFAVMLASGSVVLFSMLIFSPLYDLWFGRAMNLGPELVDFMSLPASAMILIPPTVVWMSWLRGQLTRRGLTRGVTLGSLTELICVVLLMLIIPLVLPDESGALYAVVSMSLARIISCGFMGVWLRSRGSGN